MRWFGGLATLLAVALGGPATAEQVVHEHAGLELVGNLVVPAGRSLEKDGAVLILHGTLAFHGQETVASLQKALGAKGKPSLAITLSLGLNARKSMFDCAIEQDHRNVDAVEELVAWTAWLKGRGVKRITVAGHSRGAAQVALFARDVLDPAIGAVVLIAPVAQSRATVTTRYRAAFKADLDGVLAEARRLVEAGDDDKLMDVAFLTCPRTRVTAAAFLDYYDDERTLELAKLLPELKLPVHVVLAEKDEVAAETPAALDRLGRLAHVTRATIPGADHFFRDLSSDDLADAVVSAAAR
ncbi:MAG TPA: alpha/beta fold hydrolase [Hyphomicrobiaceae bacterium]|nr:alpha/beta fold hydrolase [Hyphomicrobiaceae bacterium]